jgi:hypothetical protein
MEPAVIRIADYGRFAAGWQIGRDKRVHLMQSFLVALRQPIRVIPPYQLSSISEELGDQAVVGERALERDSIGANLPFDLFPQNP